MRPWNPGYRSRKVIQIGMPTIRKFGCGFKFTFNSNYSNYGTILYCLRDIATYWSKIANFFISHLYLAPLPGWPRRNFASVFDIRKTRMLRLPLGEEITTMFIRSNRQTDRQTDRQTELLYQYRAIKMSRCLFHKRWPISIIYGT